jgi:hypothetical protein
MKNKILFSFLILLSFTFGCQSILQKEIFIKPSEIGVFLDVKKGELTTLNPGKHKINKQLRLFIYKVTDTVAKINLSVLSKDNQEATLSIHYWYNINSKEIINLHKEIGPDYVNFLIFPNVYHEVRKLSKNYNEFESDELREKVKENLLNNENLSKYIVTKSIIIKNISD